MLAFSSYPPFDSAPFVSTPNPPFSAHSLFLTFLSFTIVKQAFRTSLELHYNCRNSFYYNLIKISEYYDLPNFDPNNLSEAMIKDYIDIIKQKYIIYWQHTIHHSKKVRFYNIFKRDYKI